MAKILVKGKRGAARAYVTRSAAVKKLQCTLADFRRLCILKGNVPPNIHRRTKYVLTLTLQAYFPEFLAVKSVPIRETACRRLSTMPKTLPTLRMSLSSTSFASTRPLLKSSLVH